MREHEDIEAYEARLLAEAFERTGFKEQLRQAEQAAREEALEEAAQTVLTIDIDGLEVTIAEEIRALKDKP